MDGDAWLYDDWGNQFTLDSLQSEVDWNAVASGWEGLAADSAAQNAEAAGWSWQDVGDAARRLVSPDLVARLLSRDQQQPASRDLVYAVPRPGVPVAPVGPGSVAPGLVVAGVVGVGAVVALIAFARKK